MAVLTEKELLESVRSKRIPMLNRTTSSADLSLQEFEIMNAVRDCDSLAKVDSLLDKFVAYVAMAKCHTTEVPNGRINAKNN